MPCSKAMLMPIAWGKMGLSPSSSHEQGGLVLTWGPGDLQVTGIRDKMTLNHQN